MSNLMANNINIIIILLTIILIKYTEATRAQNNKSDIIKDYDELYGNFTAIEFLKDFQRRFQQTYDNVLIMNNQNATISAIFYTNSINALNDNAMNTTATNGTTTADSGILSENLTSASTSASLTFAAQLMLSLQVPILQLNELQSFYLKRHLGEHLISIVYIDINIADIQMTLNDHKGLLQKLSLNLLHITTTKVLFLMNFPLAMKTVANEDIVENVVVKLFQYCWQQKIINVVALLADYQITRTFYSYSHFPVFQLEIKNMQQQKKAMEKIYPYRLGNLNGYKLPIVIGGSDPRIIPFKSPSGELIIGGFVGHFVTAFSKKYNATLIEPLPFNPELPMPSQDLIKAVRNGTVEFSAALTFPDIPLIGFSYGYEQLNWCIMVPVEANVPNYKFFTLVFKGETYVLVIVSLVIISAVLSAALYIHGYHPDLLDVICHDDCLRGILGQSFSEITNPPKIVRFIYLQICTLGILLTTTYNSYYSTYVTSAPKEAALNNFDDILHSGLRVLAWEPEYTELLGRVKEFQKYTPMFFFEKNFKKYLQMRDSLNIKYGYAVPTTKWTIVREQQKVFTSPLFRHTSDLCFFNNIPMCFPLHENSIFNSLIYQLILETAQSGLTNYWSENGFRELIMADKLRLVDLSNKPEFVEMKVDDLQYIFIFMGSMLAFVTVVFFGELAVYYRNNIFRRLRKTFCASGDGKAVTNSVDKFYRVGDQYYNKVQFRNFE